MQTKKRAKPVKFGIKAKEEGEKVEKVEIPKEESSTVVKPAELVQPEPTTLVAQPQSAELVDKLSDVPFETDFGSPSVNPVQSATPVSPPTPIMSTSEPIPFVATSTNPIEPHASEEPTKTDPPPSLSPSININPVLTIPPIGRANEPIPFNQHETVFNTPPDAGEKKKNPFLSFLIIAFVAFLTGIAFMAGIYYAMPDKNFFAMPQAPSLPGIPAVQPSPTARPFVKISPTAVVEQFKLSDYSVKVLNGSGISGQAAKVKAALETEGFTVSIIGNADRNDVVKTQIVVKKTVNKSVVTKMKGILQKSYALEKETELPTSVTQESDITITIGSQTAQ